MTRTNWILVVALAFLLGVGALGVGRLPARLGMTSKATLWKPAPVAALATGKIGSAGSTDGGGLQQQKITLEKKVSDARASAKSRVDAVVGIRVATAAGVSGADVEGLVKGWSPDEAIKAFGIVRDKVAKHIAKERENLKLDTGSGAEADPFKAFDPVARILPAPGDAFFVGESSDKGTRFVWVGDANKGFWMATGEMAQQPAALKFVAGGLDLGRSLNCRMPKAQEWLDALGAKNPEIGDLDGGFGERLAGGQVIGRAEKAGLTNLGPDWNKPMPEADRVKMTKGKAATAVVGETGQQLLEAIVREIPEAKNEGRALPAKINFYREKLRAKRQAEEDAKAVGAGETEFRYRWVIDPPIASQKPTP